MKTLRNLAKLALALSFFATAVVEGFANQPVAISYTVTIPRGISTIANHLDHGGNTVAEVLPSMPEGTLLYKYDESRSSFTVNHYQSGAWSRPTETLAPGEGTFIRSPGIEFSISFTGTKPSNAQFPQLYRGLNLVSLPVPGETPLPTAKDGDEVYQFNASFQRWGNIFVFDSLENNWFPALDDLGTWMGTSFFYGSYKWDLPLPPAEPEPGGTVYFCTHLPDAGRPDVPLLAERLGAVDARITSPDGTPLGEGFTAQLYGGPAGTPIDKLVPLTPTTTFQTGSAAVRGYVKPVLVTPSGVARGVAVTLIMRVFEGASFESSVVRGQSKPITIRWVGISTVPPANLTGLQGFTVPPVEGTPYTLKMPPGISTIANHLDHGENTVAELLPSVPEGTLLYKYDRTRTSYVVNHFQSGTWAQPKQTLAPGEGAFIRNPENEISITFMGTKAGAPFPQLYRGDNFVSLPVPGQTPLPTAYDGDSIFRFDASLQKLNAATFDALSDDWALALILEGLLTKIGESFLYRSFDLNRPLPPLDPVSGGTIYFSTHLREAGPSDIASFRDYRRAVEARITWTAGTGIGEGFTAQLYGGPAGTPLDQLMPLTPATTFQTTSMAVMGYVKPVLVAVPGVHFDATLILRVFDGGSFETSNIRGESNPIIITLGGGVLPPANLVGLQGFSLPGPPGEKSYSLSIPQGISTLANHLNHGGNTLAELVPSVPEGTLLYKYDKSRISYSVNHFQSGAWAQPQQTLAPGEGAFIRNPGNEFSISFIGTKPNNQFPQLDHGLNFISLPVPGLSSLPIPTEGDSFYQFDSSTQGWSVSTFDGLDNEWIPPRRDLWTKIGASFFYRLSNPDLRPGPVEPRFDGTVYFSTHLPDAGLPEMANHRDRRRAVDARITWPDGTGVGEGFTAQLCGGPSGIPIDQLVPLTPTTTFQTTSAEVKGYVKPILVTPPDVTPGLSATLILRVFDGASFESSSMRGESKPITISVGGGVELPANLVGLEGFSLPGGGSKIGIERTADGITLTYTGTLQAAGAVTGPYADVTGAASPATIKFNGTAKFYRLKP